MHIVYGRALTSWTSTGITAMAAVIQTIADRVRPCWTEWDCLAKHACRLGGCIYNSILIYEHSNKTQLNTVEPTHRRPIGA